MTSILYNTNNRGGAVKEIVRMREDIKSNRLKELRTESKITQAQLADYLGVDQSMVTKLENGSRKLNVTLIDKICNLFGCTQKYLTGEDDRYIPLSFSFRANGLEKDDLESIAAVNKIIMNIRFMNEILGGRQI